MAIDLCDLENILDKINCPLKTLEIAFQSFSDFKIFLGEKTQTRQVAHLIGASVIRRWLKNIPILHI